MKKALGTSPFPMSSLPHPIQCQVLIFADLSFVVDGPVKVLHVLLPVFSKI